MIKHGSWLGDIIYNQVALEPIMSLQSNSEEIFLFSQTFILFMYYAVASTLISISYENYFSHIPLSIYSQEKK